jgi:hypothetical protein
MVDIVVHSDIVAPNLEIILGLANDYMFPYLALEGSSHGLLHCYEEDTRGSEILDDVLYDLENHALIVPGRILDRGANPSPGIFRIDDHSFQLVASTWGLGYGIGRAAEKWFERVAKVVSRAALRAVDVQECSEKGCIMAPVKNYGLSDGLQKFIEDLDTRRAICGNHSYSSPVP